MGMNWMLEEEIGMKQIKDMVGGIIKLKIQDILSEGEWEKFKNYGQDINPLIQTQPH